ncbi:MAG TPA: LysE family translocator [Candidatus Mucispirillum faecigallinarum]|uniref:LysE family translocator n=1 Tax=Candidatus Mucispirillum faecigallinarum TaxID=2838699 RepID=A0A9D2KA67_9BACT|nr:LysE family translocator [Candidatus Mucispirillum faecigallinarum]
MENITNYYGFILSVILLSITPGADTVFILTKSIAGGYKQGLASVAGIVCGLFVHTSLAAFGLSVILMTSALLFNIVKIAGAAYLIYLGIMALKSKSKINLENKGEIVPFFTTFRQGFFTNILNPKVALFFLALLPQFVKSNAESAVPFLILGLTFIFIGSLWSLFLVWASARMSQALRQSKFSFYLNKAAGVIFIALGLNILRLRN